MLNSQNIRKLGKIDKIMNELNIFDRYAFLNRIFQEQGIYVNDYKINAYPFKSAFILRVRKKDFIVDFSVKDILNKSWKDNIKLDNKIKEILDQIYYQFVLPNLNDFNLSLDTSKTLNQKLEFSKFLVMKKETTDVMLKVYCKKDKLEKSIDECSNCNLFIQYSNNKVICYYTYQLKI